MNTPVGEGLKGRPWQAIAVWIVALAAISSDIWMSAVSRHNWERAIFAAIAVAAYLVVTRNDIRTLGLNIVPINGANYWLRLACLLATLLATVGILGILASTTVGLPEGVCPVLTAPREISTRILPMCLTGPLGEEFMYRLILCVPIAAVSPVLAIFVSGATFAGLHFAYGNPSADNFLAGYLLAWIYLKSGSVWTSFLFHAGGNAIILCFQVIAWYVFAR